MLRATSQWRVYHVVKFDGAKTMIKLLHIIIVGRYMEKIKN